MDYLIHTANADLYQVSDDYRLALHYAVLYGTQEINDYLLTEINVENNFEVCTYVLVLMMFVLVLDSFQIEYDLFTFFRQDSTFK